MANLHSPLREEQYESGIFDDFADQLQAMGPAALSEASYNKDFFRQLKEYTSNYFYVDTNGNEYNTHLIGEVRPIRDGTILSAKGNHYHGKPGDVRFITDKSNVRNVLVIGTPAGVGDRLAIMASNHRATLDDMRVADEVEEHQNNEYPVVKEANRPSCSDPSAPMGFTAIHLPSTYADTDEPARPDNKIKPKRATKRTLDDMQTDSAPTASLVESAADAVTIPDSADLHVGALYDLNLLPDHRGPVFQQKTSKLIQLDVRDTDNALIPPWEMYSALRPGTIVLIRATLHCFNYSDGPKPRKVYQLNAHSVRVLANSDSDVEERLPPSLPGQSFVNAIASGSGTSTKSFDDFVVPKKQKTD